MEGSTTGCGSTEGKGGISNVSIELAAKAGAKFASVKVLSTVRLNAVGEVTIIMLAKADSDTSSFKNA